MGRRRRPLTGTLVALATCVCFVAPGRAQSTQPVATTRPVATTSRRATPELPERVMRLLARVKDFSFNYDYPGYYALLRHMKRGGRSPGHATEPVFVKDWGDLLARPSDFRGEPITIEGIIGRNKDPYTHPKHRDLGQFWQIELHRSGQPLTCTVIFTTDVGDLPVGGLLRLTGYFVLVRNYKSRTQKVMQSAVIVAIGPKMVTRTGPRSTAGDEKLDWKWIVAAIVFGLLIVVIVLRRSVAAAGRGRTYAETLHAEHGAPFSLADELADWAEPTNDETGSDPEPRTRE